MLELRLAEAANRNYNTIAMRLPWEARSVQPNNCGDSEDLDRSARDAYQAL